jgi:molybdopterin molybdotransferase
MLTVDEALKLVLDHARPLPQQKDRQVAALGRILAEPVTSDIDSPPHDKSIVDGFAVRSADLATAGAVLRVIEHVPAGAVPTKTVEHGQATRIMTGAPLPAGADAVVMVERTTDLGDSRVRIDTGASPGQNIMRQASSMARGQIVLEAGKLLRGIELGLLAEVGCEDVPVIPEPQTYIIATGNELVGFWEKPGPGQIRNSNSLLLWGLAMQAGAYPIMHGIARDTEEDLRAKISKVIDAPLIILSGGVSAGQFDLVPKILAELGVEQVFHKVNLKPGKPLWFGLKDHEHNGRRTLVFGLPGNPVSTLVGFELFVRPAIKRLCGFPAKGLPQVKAVLTKDHQQRGERPAYWPARTDNPGYVTPLPWKGSGDLRTLTDADCLAHFPAGDRLFRAGEEVEVLLLPQPRAELAGPQY